MRRLLGTALLAGLLTSSACDKLSFIDAKAEPTPFADASKELTARANVPVVVRPSGAKEGDKAIAEVLVIFQEDPSQSPAELERFANLVVRKHVPGVQTVKFQYAPRGGRPPR